MSYFGASPDGLVGADGLLEIKCPYSSQKHLARVAEGVVPEEYKPQMLVQLLCTGRKWVDFVSYDPRIVGPWAKARFFLIRFEPTQAELSAALEECQKFLAIVDERLGALKNKIA